MEISVNNLTFSYSKKSPIVLDDVSYTFASNKTYALIGKNGVGKTTLGKVILGLVKLKKGDVFIDGRNAKKMRPGKRAEKIGYLFQNPDYQLFASSVLEELSFPFELKKQYTDEVKTKIQALICEFNLQGKEERYPLSLSGGEKQRLALATIMSRDIDFIILDEPTSSIDNVGREYIAGFINEFVENGGGAIIITHDEDLLGKLDNPTILKLEGGKICES